MRLKGQHALSILKSVIKSFGISHKSIYGISNNSNKYSNNVSLNLCALKIRIRWVNEQIYKDENIINNNYK